MHLLITPFQTVERSVQLVKGGFSFRAKREFEWQGEIWQPGFTNRRIRSKEDWLNHMEYIRLNPLRAGLATETEKYEFIGFPKQEFPQGLKPAEEKDAYDVRAKARTLQG